MRQVIRRASLGFLAAAIAFSSFIFLPSEPTTALSASEFSPGRIIDDGVFENRNTMGVAEIQQFLNAKVPTCDNWGTESYAGTTRRAYAEARGVTFPLTCLKDYRENPDTKQNNLEGRAAPAGSISAAQIIFNVSQQYFINPQVLIVLLQKEQALVGDEWPWPIQFKKATGYGCPDTAPCDSQYFGFYNQVKNAAARFRAYANSPNSYNHVPHQDNFVRWSPTTSCGGSTLYIFNQATASLYNYTPYRPNQAAMDNLYGSGDGCSAYGNRNFWRFFRDWFGTTYADPFMWQPTELYVMDEGKNVNMPTDFLHKGERLFVVIKGKNLGTETWYRDGVNPARLGTWNPRDHKSPYCDTTWIPISNACERPAKLVEASVAPGQTFHFETYIHAPNQGGQFREYFQAILEGRAWMTNQTGFHIYVNSTNFYNWQWRYFDAWTNSSKTTRVNMNSVAQGQEVYIELKVKNQSATVWKNSGPNPTRLGAQSADDKSHNSPMCHPGTWLACNRPAAISESSVEPGEFATFGFTLKAPATNGEYREYFKPLIEGKGWMRTTNNHIYMKVTH